MDMAAALVGLAATLLLEAIRPPSGRMAMHLQRALSAGSALRA
jgi:hypothetical protein